MGAVLVSTVIQRFSRSCATDVVNVARYSKVGDGWRRAATKRSALLPPLGPWIPDFLTHITYYPCRGLLPVFAALGSILLRPATELLVLPPRAKLLSSSPNPMFPRVIH